MTTGHGFACSIVLCCVGLDESAGGWRAYVKGKSKQKVHINPGAETGHTHDKRRCKWHATPWRKYLWISLILNRERARQRVEMATGVRCWPCEVRKTRNSCRTQVANIGRRITLSIWGIAQKILMTVKCPLLGETSGKNMCFRSYKG